MTGSAGVMALVLAETVAGSAAFLWCTPLWREVKRGYFTLTGVVLTVLAFAAWRAAAAGAIAGDAAGDVERPTRARELHRHGGVDGAATRSSGTRRRGSWGSLSVPVSIAVLAAMAATGRQHYALALFELLAGAAFLGSVLDGLLLGHWYLTDRGLSRTPINRATTIMLVAVALEAVAVIAGRVQRRRARPRRSTRS